jgi:hypothetical protein
MAKNNFKWNFQILNLVFHIQIFGLSNSELDIKQIVVYIAVHGDDLTVVRNAEQTKYAVVGRLNSMFSLLKSWDKTDIRWGKTSLNHFKQCHATMLYSGWFINKIFT